MPPKNPFSFGASPTPFSFGAGMDGTQATPKPTVTPPNPAAPLTTPPAAPGAFDISTFLQWLMGQAGQQQAPTPINFGQQVAGIRQAKDPQGEHNKAYMPGVTNSANPFANGFFQSY